MKDEQSREAPERVWIWEGDAEYHLDHSYGGCDSTEFVRADLPTPAGIERAMQIVKTWQRQYFVLSQEMSLAEEAREDFASREEACTQIIAALEAEKEKLAT